VLGYIPDSSAGTMGMLVEAAKEIHNLTRGHVVSDEGLSVEILTV